MFEKITHEPGTKLAVLRLETKAYQTYYFVKDYERHRLSSSMLQVYQSLHWEGVVFFFSLWVRSLLTHSSERIFEVSFLFFLKIKLICKR